MKLKIHLTQSELLTLRTCLTLYVRVKAEDLTLRNYPGEFLALSVLYDLAHAVAKKADKWGYFGGEVPPKVKLSLNRNAALALYCYGNEVLDADTTLAVRSESFEGNLLQRLQAQIHRMYLV